MVRLYVCKICGEPYLGSDPDDCLFCGAQKVYMESMENFSELWKTELTKQEIKDLNETLKLEINATSFYEKISNSHPKYSYNNLLFKQLSRVEKEHAEIVAKFLNKKMPKIKGEDLKGSLKKDLVRTQELEKDAVRLYVKFLKNAKNKNVKSLYDALVHSEKGHVEVVTKEVRNL